MSDGVSSRWAKHGVGVRGLDTVVRSQLRTGLFGRMFRNLPPCDLPESVLVELAATMVEEQPNGTPEELARERARKTRLHAGYTYFGQFIDHDLTFDPTSSLQRASDPDALVDFRTPRFDLDSVYGGGPDVDPFLYTESPRTRARTHFALGTPSTAEHVEDLFRNEDQLAVIADPRNDENAIISQIHLALLRYHNKVVDELAGQRSGGRAALFAAARQIVTWHYQWAVLTDFLPVIVGSGVHTGPGERPDRLASLGDLLTFEPISWPSSVKPGGLWQTRLRHFKWHSDPFMPVEFSAAAFRFGHSMVRNHYAINQSAESVSIILFDVANGRDLKGGTRLRRDMVIDWRLFFPSPGDGANRLVPQLARPIDTLITEPLSVMPASVAGSTVPEMRSLALRNLRRGRSLGLPSGQSVARAMGVPEDLIIGEGRPLEIQPRGINSGSLDLEALSGRIAGDTPLWYYVLAEAEQLCAGEHLGPVGATIVAEVLVGLLAGDPHSFVNMDPLWQPKAGHFGCVKDGEFGLMDLLLHSR